MNQHQIQLYIITLLCLYSFQLKAQEQEKHEGHDNLFTAGHASAFIGGLYDGYLLYSDLLLHGDFGLGAPDKLDGELLILDGKIYQTQSSGKTSEIQGTGLTPFSVVNFFNTDYTFKVPRQMDKDQLYAYLDSILPNQNGIYAIRIKGAFNKIETRAFPPVSKKPYAALAKMIPLQQFFAFIKVKGDLVGYRIPNYMEGPNIVGYHFHFLSEDKTGGGHIINLLTDNITIEVDYLNSFTVSLPQTKDFESFDLNKDRREELKQVENGM